MIHNAETYSPNSSDKFLIDTNIWLFLHCPIGNHKGHIVAKYSQFFKKMLTANSQIIVCSAVVSEFLNRYVKIDYELRKQTDRAIQEYKKTYRPSAHYRLALKQAVTALNGKILPGAKRITDNFEVISTDNIFSHTQNVDISDGYLFELIRGQNIKILTDDSDFSHFKNDCEIYTTNPKLIAMGRTTQV